MALQWVAADLRTGSILADVPTFVPQWPLRRTLCKYETATGDLYLDGAPPNWQEAIREGGAVLACYDDADQALAIQWAGIVTEQTRDTANDKVTVSMCTAEGYLDRRIVGDYSVTATGQNRIASDLVTLFAADGGDADPGLPLVVVNLDSGDGTPRDRSYLDSENASVYLRLCELSAVSGGIEFTIEWEWSSDNRSLVPTFCVGSRIGVSAPSGMLPAASFEMPGPVVNAQQVRSYADGKGANRVVAYSTGQGANVPTSGPQAVTDFEGRPIFEYRYQPSTSITDPATLVDYAKAAVAILGPGVDALTLTAQLLDETRHGNLWRIGDDIAFSLGGSLVDPDTGDAYELVACFPGGYEGVARSVAYELTQDPSQGETISPILGQVKGRTKRRTSLSSPGMVIL
jgi:hypothetical protein